MLWQETTDNVEYIVPDSVQDLSFKIRCRELPGDHAGALRNAITNALPWISDEPLAGIQSIFGAASSNGWVRPDQTLGQNLQLSRRTRLNIRLPRQRIDEAKSLQGQTLNIDGHELTIGEPKVKTLIPSATIFARSVSFPQIEDEEAFSLYIQEQLGALDIRVNKMLCGLMHQVKTDDQPLSARSVLLADLKPEESIRIQQTGIGAYKLTGCGIFIPHKSLASVVKSQDEIE